MGFPSHRLHCFFLFSLIPICPRLSLPAPAVQTIPGSPTPPSRSAHSSASRVVTRAPVSPLSSEVFLGCGPRCPEQLEGHKQKQGAGECVSVCLHLGGRASPPSVTMWPGESRDACRQPESLSGPPPPGLHGILGKRLSCRRGLRLPLTDRKEGVRANPRIGCFHHYAGVSGGGPCLRDPRTSTGGLGGGTRAPVTPEVRR